MAAGNRSEVMGLRWRNTREKLRSATVGLLIALGSIGLGVYAVVYWAEKHVLTPDNWVAMVAPLPRQPVVYTALGNHISEQLFSAAPVQQRITDALPPQASFLAGPLTSQLQTLTTRAAQQLVASDGFQSIWTGANQLAMERLVATARGETPPLQERINQRFNINLAGAGEKLGGALGTAAEAIPALQPAADKAASISADLQARPRRIHAIIRATDFLAAILPLFIAASLLGALALSRQRRRTTLTIGIAVITAMLLELVALKWLRNNVLDRVRNADNLPAVSYIFDTLTGQLREVILAILLIGLALAALSLLAGPATWASRLRSFINVARLQQTAPIAWWHSLRRWVRRWQSYLLIAAVLLVLAVLALFVDITTQAIINAILLAVCLMAAIHIIATPGGTNRRTGGASTAPPNAKPVTPVTA